MSEGPTRARRLAAPISLQIVALLLGGLVVAQLTTLGLTLAFPPPPPPQYGLDEIARALQGEAVRPAGARPLVRVLQPAPPSLQSPGWVAPDSPRGELARRLNAPEADVRLLFYAPPPFAGVPAPPRARAVSYAPTAGAAGDARSPAAFVTGQAIGAGPGGGLPPGGPGGLGGPLPGGLPGGGFPTRGTPAGGFPGSAPAGPPPVWTRRGGDPTGGTASSRLPAPAASPASPGPAGVVLPSPIARAPLVVVQSGPAIPGSPPQAPGSGPIGRTGPAGSIPGAPQIIVSPDEPVGSAGGRWPGGLPSRPVILSPPIDPTPGPVWRAPPLRREPMAPPVGRGDPDPPPVLQEHSARVEPPPTAELERPKPAPALEPAQPRLAAAPRPEAAPGPPAPPPERLITPPLRRGLFGLAPAAFVEGDFVAALRVGPNAWAVVSPKPEAFPNSWQRRVLLWFAISFGIVAPLGWLFARRLAAPIDAFASAAERLGRDPSAPVMASDGPAEVGRAARAFNDMQRRLKRYIDDRTAMMGAISHDLRTPLARMRFRAERAPPELRATLHRDIEQMEGMISAVLAFMRDSASASPRERVDLRSILECVIDDAASVGGEVELEPGAPAEVEVDVMGVQRVFANLIDNALKYGENASVRLYVDADEAVTEIVDHGPGLPDEEIEQVFAPFYRAAKDRASARRGIGLGLAVSRSTVRAHGGDIRLKRGHEGGLVAQVRLPAVRRSA